MAQLPRRRRVILWVQTVCAVLSGLLGLLTLVWHDWLEAFGWDPDHGNGTVEWGVVVCLLVVAVALGTTAGLQWRQLARQS